jgi:nicotinate-nucleotide adenylyltransferase
MDLGSQRRIGVLGGTFDPIHYGHLAAAEEAVSVCNLERVLFVPAARPPHKRGETISGAEHRVSMVRRAIEDNPTFLLSDLEIHRRGPSYTVDTLRQLHRDWVASELFFIVGMDSLAELPLWHQPEALLEQAVLVAIQRPGVPDVDLHELSGRLPLVKERVRLVAMPGLGLAVSSTELRERVASGRSIRYLVPESVREYIRQAGLYRNAQARGGPESLT